MDEMISNCTYSGGPITNLPRLCIIIILTFPMMMVMMIYMPAFVGARMNEEPHLPTSYSPLSRHALLP